MRVKQKMQEMRELAQVLLIDWSIPRVWRLLCSRIRI
jgi:hypothetical protein